MQYSQFLPHFSYFLMLFHLPKSSQNKSAKYETLGKYCSYCTKRRAITNTSIFCLVAFSNNIRSNFFFICIFFNVAIVKRVILVRYIVLTKLTEKKGITPNRYETCWNSYVVSKLVSSFFRTYN